MIFIGIISVYLSYAVSLFMTSLLMTSIGPYAMVDLIPDLNEYRFQKGKQGMNNICRRPKIKQHFESIAYRGLQFAFL